MKMDRTSVVNSVAFCLLLALAGAGPATGPSDQQTQAHLRALETEVSGLQRQLADSQAKNKLLQDQNTALVQRIGGASPAAAKPDAHFTFARPKQPAATTEPSGPAVLTLADPQWDANEHATAQQLRSDVDGTTITLKPVDDALVVDATDATHLTISVRHVNRGSGTQSHIGVARLWLEGTALNLQWIERLHEPEAMSAMQFAVLEVTGGSGGRMTFQFFKPGELTIGVSRASTTKVNLPPGMTSPIVLKPCEPPDGWQVGRATDISLSMKSGDATWQLTYGAPSSSLFFTRSEGQQQKLDALNAELKAKQHDLDQIQAAQLRSAEKESQAQRTAQLADGRDKLAAAQKEVATLNQSITAMNTQIATDQKQWSALDGCKLTLVLSNGATVATVGLVADK